MRAKEHPHPQTLIRQEDNIMKARELNWDFILVGVLMAGVLIWAAFSWDLFW